jgi:5-methyltetrahydropteroyltriglutamate--homocysteine methyltransferase
MKRSTERILTTHVGSLVRPLPILEALKAEAYGEPIDQQAFTSNLKSAVRDVVARQTDIGIDVVSDGEYGKVGWNNYILERFTGLSLSEVRQGYRYVGRDRSEFPEFYAKYDRYQYTAWLPESLETKSELVRWECTGPITYKGREPIDRDIANFKAALADTDATEAFLPVVSPGSAEASHRNQYYSTAEEYVYAIADALKPEYRAIVDAGLLLQVDDAFMPTLYDALYPNITMEDYLKFSDMRIEALNYALEGIPPDRVRYHICWGSWNAPHVGDVPLRDIVDIMFKVNARGYSIEAANPRHEHEWRVWEDVKLPDDTILIPGVVTHSTNVVEHPELVAWRITNFARLVGRDNVIASTDCGFAQHWNLNRVHETVQWAKLRALSEGASLASQELWP